MTIHLDEIQAGDEVLIKDNFGNQARGTAGIDHRTSTAVLWIPGFGGRIEFGKHREGGWQRMNRIEVVWHQPQILFEDSRA